MSRANLAFWYISRIASALRQESSAPLKTVKIEVTSMENMTATTRISIKVRPELFFLMRLSGRHIGSKYLLVRVVPVLPGYRQVYLP